MADGIRKVDEKELVRAHVYTLLGEPEEGALATKKAGIAYDAIREYSKVLSPLSTQKLRDLYAEAANEGQREEFEKALYGILYIYGLGRTGYSQLAKALGGVENAAEFVSNADTAIANATQKSKLKVAYPSYPVQMPGMKIVGNIPKETVAEETPKARVEIPLPQERGGLIVEKLPRGAKRPFGAEPVAIDCTKELTGKGIFRKFEGLESLRLLPLGGLENVEVKVRDHPISEDAERCVQINSGDKMYFLEYERNPNNRNEHRLRLTNWSEDNNTKNYEVYSVKKTGDGFSVEKIAESGKRAPFDLSIGLGGTTFSTVAGKLDYVPAPLALGMRPLDKFFVSSPSLGGLEAKKVPADPELGGRRYDVSGKAPNGEYVTYKLEIYKNESGGHSLKVAKVFPDYLEVPQNRRDSRWYNIDGEGRVTEAGGRGNAPPLNITMGTFKNMAYTIDERGKVGETTLASLEKKRQPS